MQAYLPLLGFIGFIFFTCGLLFLVLLGLNCPKSQSLEPKSLEESRAVSSFALGSRFYRIAVFLVLFTIDIIFLFPWSLSLRTLGQFGFWSMNMFLGVLVVSFVYAERKGVFSQE